jgi:hypothetical protein
MLLWDEIAHRHMRAVVILGTHALRGEVRNFFTAGVVIQG